MANPAGSLIFSEVIGSGIYDHYAKEQAALRHHDSASMLIKPLRDDDSLSCVGTPELEKAEILKEQSRHFQDKNAKALCV
ncbi:hypothetical protein ACE6H2_017775 [Prunus campanulata]